MSSDEKSHWCEPKKRFQSNKPSFLCSSSTFDYNQSCVIKTLSEEVMKVLKNETEDLAFLLDVVETVTKRSSHLLLDYEQNTAFMCPLWYYHDHGLGCALKNYLWNSRERRERGREHVFYLHLNLNVAMGKRTSSESRFINLPGGRRHPALFELQPGVLLWRQHN